MRETSRQDDLQLELGGRNNGTELGGLAVPGSLDEATAFDEGWTCWVSLTHPYSEEVLIVYGPPAGKLRKEVRHFCTGSDMRTHSGTMMKRIRMRNPLTMTNGKKRHGVSIGESV